MAPAAGSAARSAEGQAATNRLALLALQHSAAKARPRSASRAAAVAMTTGSVSGFFGPTAVGSAKASLGLLRGGRQTTSGQVWSARSGCSRTGSSSQHSSGTLRIFVSPPELMPNPSFKPSPNSVARRPSSAGPAARFALAVQRATLSVPA